MRWIVPTEFDNLYEELNNLYEDAELVDDLTDEEQRVYDETVAHLPNSLDSVNFVPLDRQENDDAGIYVVKHNLPSKRGTDEQYSFYIGKANPFRNRRLIHFRGQEKKGIDDNSMLHKAVRADRKAVPDEDPDGKEADKRIGRHFSWGRLITLPQKLASQSKNKINSKLERAAIKKYHTWKADEEYDGVSFNVLPGGEGGGSATKLVGEAKAYVEQELKNAAKDAKNYNGRANPYYSIRAIAKRTVDNYGAMYDFNSLDDTTVAKYNKRNQWLSKDQIDKNSSAATAFTTSQPGILKINNEAVGGLTLNGVPTGWYPSLSLIALAILNIEKENSPQALYNLKKNIQKNFSRNKNKKEFITHDYTTDYTIIKAEPKTVEEIYGPAGQSNGAYIDVKDGKKR